MPGSMSRCCARAIRCSTAASPASSLGSPNATRSKSCLEFAAGAAAAAIPLTQRDETLTVVPATLAEATLATRLAATDVAAIVKLGRHLEKVKRVLRRLGTLDTAIYVEHASLPDGLVRPLAEVDRAPYFSMTVVRAASGAC
jgi:precorrin-2/cobalt-factor-2 C20-methyltransferase